MTIQVIAAQIHTVAQHSYTAWQIGITNDPAARKQEWGSTKDVSAWREWLADSLNDAQAIETYFINDKKMKGGTGGATSPFKDVYVYIF